MKPGLCLISADAMQSLAGGYRRAPSPQEARWTPLAALFASLRLGLARWLDR
jgi:hypothetical protein